jgi:hypothetical protein
LPAQQKKEKPPAKRLFSSKDRPVAHLNLNPTSEPLKIDKPRFGSNKFSIQRTEAKEAEIKKHEEKDDSGVK